MAMEQQSKKVKLTEKEKTLVPKVMKNVFMGSLLLGVINIFQDGKTEMKKKI